MKKYNFNLEDLSSIISTTSPEVLSRIHIDLDTDKSLKPKKQREFKNENVLSIKNLHVYFKTHGHDSHVIRGISLDIKRGETFAIVGESGSGKSVFTKCLNGMNDSNSKIKQGKIELNEVTVHDPKVTKNLFKISDSRKNCLLSMQKRSLEEVNKRIVEKKEKENSATINKLTSAQNKINSEVIINSKKEKNEVSLSHKTEYYELKFTDLINKSLTKKAKASLRKQKKVSSYSKLIDSIMRKDELSFGDDSIKEFINTSILKFENDKKFVVLNETYNKLREKINEVSKLELDPKLLLNNKDLDSNRDYYDAVKNASNLLVQSLEKIDEFASLVNTYLSTVDSCAKFVNTVENKLELMNSLNSILKVISFSLRTFSLNTLKAIYDETISMFKILHNEVVKTNSSNASISKSSLNKFVQITSEVRKSITQDILQADLNTLIESYISKANELVDKLLVESDRRAAIRNVDSIIKVLGKLPLEVSQLPISQLEVLSSTIYNIDEVDETHHNNALANYMAFVNFYTRCLDIKINALDEIEDANIRNYSILKAYYVNLYSLQLSQNLNLFSEQVKSNEEQSKEQYDSINSQIEQFKLSSQEELNNLKLQLDEKLKTCIEENSAYLNTELFNDDEREYFKSFTKEDLMYIIKTKLALIDLYNLRDRYMANGDSYKESLLESFSENDDAKFINIAKVINPSLVSFLKDLRKEESEIVKTNNDIDSRISSLDSNSPTFEARVELLETERQSKLSTLNTQIELAHKKMINDIKMSDINNSNVILNIDKYINKVANLQDIEVKVNEGKLPQNPHIDDLVNSLKERGIIYGDTVNLAKLQTNKEWSMIRGSRIATIFQDPMTSLNPLLSIGEQISEVLRIHHNLSKREAKKEAISLLSKVKIPQPEERYKEYPFQYSGGMRQRVVIAIALACRPDILICDEPTTALDVTVQSQILDLIKDLQKDYHFTIIFITHDLGVVAGVADRIGVMYGGQIVEYGTDEDIFYRPLHPYTWALLSSLPQLAVSNEPLTYIKGNPPSFNKEIVGDSFAPRSNYAMKIDFIMEPDMIKVTDTHFAKTWLLDKRAPKVKKPAIIRNLEQRMQETAKEFLASSEEEN